MARYMIHFDGFHSRSLWGPSAQSAGGKSPYGNAYPGTPAYQDAVPNEGRYFGQAWNGSYDIERGGWIHFMPSDLATFGLKDWWQWGYWYKYKQNIPTYWLSMFRPYHSVMTPSSLPFLDSDTSFGTVTSPTDIYDPNKVCYRWGSSSTQRIYGTNTVYAANMIQADQWYWVEERVYTDLTNGVYELRLNGVQLDRLTGKTMSQDYGGFNSIHWQASGATSTNWYDFRFDDIYMMAGDSESDLYWLGNSVCEPIVPTGDGDNSDGTPSTGTSHYAVVDALPASDSDYIEVSAGNAKKELYTFSDLDTTRTRTIRGVKVTARAKKTGPGTRRMRAICKIGSTVYNGDVFHVHSGWREIQHIWELSPATASAWTAAEVNGAQFGFEQVT